MRKKVSIDKIKINDSNPRTITKEKFAELVESMRSFPAMLEKRPVVVETNKDGTFTALGGNMRTLAAREAGLEKIPIDTADDWTDDERREFLVKDNISFGAWNWDVIANEWNSDELESWGLDLPALDIGFNTDFNLEDGDKAPFEQITFALSEAQAQQVKKAIEKIKNMQDFKNVETFGNENSNGNALYLLVVKWEGQRK